MKLKTSLQKITKTTTKKDKKSVGKMMSHHLVGFISSQKRIDLTYSLAHPSIKKQISLLKFIIFTRKTQL